jgi:hypothetical protein
LLFGYFPTFGDDTYNTPGTVVFGCLSHDIIAHEVTHALLDGVHPRFDEPTNPDVYAFHEAFADIVALFQHFSYPAVLESQIKKTRGSLQSENLLSQLAQQFGHATGHGSALRDALGSVNDDTGEWERQPPDPRALEKTFEPHARGAILVAAVFRAFLRIYGASSADLFRIASSGTGVLPEGDLHPDLTRRLAKEAAKCAGRVLQMCIRAIDYCPPVDITFGDFLRAVLTADMDYVPDDLAGYRTVFVQSFREWGIRPRGVTSMGIDTLVWPSGEDRVQDWIAANPGLESSGPNIRMTFFKSGDQANGWNLESHRYTVWQAQDQLRERFARWLRRPANYKRYYASLLGVVIDDDEAPRTVYRNEKGQPEIEVHSIRPTLRRTINGSVHVDLVVEITQRRRGYFDRRDQRKQDQQTGQMAPDAHGDFLYRAGATILIDPITQHVRRIIRTAGTIADNRELERVRRYLRGEIGAGNNAFDAGFTGQIRPGVSATRNEPFALLHQRSEA